MKNDTISIFCSKHPGMGINFNVKIYFNWYLNETFTFIYLTFFNFHLLFFLSVFFYGVFGTQVVAVPNQIVWCQTGWCAWFQSPNRSKTSSEDEVSTKPAWTGRYYFETGSSYKHVWEYLRHSYNVVSLNGFPSSIDLSFWSFIGC